jgi:tetratricopeptide (TPR) repeat protein
MFTRGIETLDHWSRRHERALFQFLLFSIVALALLLRTLHLTDIASRSLDEHVYSHFAERLAAEGLGAYRSIFASYAADAARWSSPSPTRIAHVLLFAGVMKFTGSTSAQAGAAVSYALAVASVALLGWLGRRFLSPFVALLAAFFLATYPVELELARRAWEDSTAAFLSLLLLASAWELEQQPRRWASRFAFFVIGTACLLAKETSLFAFGLCGVWLVAGRLFARDHRAAGVVVLGVLLSTLAALGLLVLLAGNVSYALAGILRGFGNDLSGSQYATAPWYQFPQLLALLGPFTAAMATLGALVVACVPRSARVFEGLEPGALSRTYLLTLMVLAFIATCSLGPNLQYLRLMAPAHSSYCLLAALGVRSVLVQSEDWLEGKAYPALLALLPVGLALASSRDYALYRDVVVRSGMQDLAMRGIMAGAERRGAPQLDSARQALEAAPNGSVAPAQQAQQAQQGQEAQLQRSVEHCQRREYSACVNAAQAALTANPRLPEAWNSAATGYAGLGLWDDAVRCASQALQLRPGFELARSNLTWATEQRAQERAAPARSSGYSD